MIKSGQFDRSVNLSTYSPDQQAKVTALLDEYLTRLEDGERTDEQALIEAHPDIADLLRRQLDNLRMLHQAADTPAGSGMAHYTPPRKLGEYELVREIGRGGMGIVYEANDATLNRQVALKVLPFAAVLDRKQIARFRNEAQAAAQLNHTNIVPVYSVGVDRGVHFYAMQFIDGRPLSEAIIELRTQRDVHLGQSSGQADDLDATDPWSDDRPEKMGLRPQKIANDEDVARVMETPSTERPHSISTYRYPVGDDFFRHAAQLGIQVAKGLQHAHDFGIVHRDIKPSNLLLDEAGRIWIADFGLAHIPNDVSMTATGDILGTVRYMSPEQANGRGAFVDHRTDIYSLGLTLYELVTFEPAFSTNRRERLLQKMAAEPPSPRKINRAIPVDLETIINKATATEPADRYASCREFAEDLERFVDGRPTIARPPSIMDRLAKWSHRHRRAVAAGAAILVLAALASFVGNLKLSAERNRTAAALEREKTNREMAEANLRAAKNIVDRLGIQVAADLSRIPGTENVRRELLLETQRYYDFFLQTNATADDSFGKQLRCDQAISMSKAGSVAERLGQQKKALETFSKARSRLEQLIADGDGDVQIHQELVRVINNQGVLLNRMGLTDEALAHLDFALEKIHHAERKFGEEVLIDDLASAHANRAVVLAKRENEEGCRMAYALAIETLRRALELEPENDERALRLSVCLNNLAAKSGADEIETALMYCTEAIKIQSRLISEHPEAITLGSQLASSYDTLGGLHKLSGEVDDAEENYLNAIRLRRRLSQLAPDNVQYRTELAVSLNDLGRLRLLTQRFNSALQTFEQSREIFDSLVELVPENIAFMSDLGVVEFHQGQALHALERIKDAREICLQGLEHQKEAVKRAPRETHLKKYLVVYTQEFERLFETSN